MGSLFGGKKTSSSTNQAYGLIKDQFSGVLPFAQQGGNALSALLGGDTTGFDKYKDATGYDFQAENGSRGITANAAARGLLDSGATRKSLVNYGNNLNQTFANNYMQQLLGLGNLGISGGNVLANAGQTSKSTQSGGIGGFLGGLASAAASNPGIFASDRRLKKDIRYLHTLDNGLKVYQYKYINDRGPYVGVMADEVERLMPDALGPTIDGYKTVDYSKIGMV